MKSGLHRFFADTARVERLRSRELAKEIREKKLMELKNSSFSVISPSSLGLLDWISKCSECNKDNQSLQLLHESDSWYEDYVDILKMNLKVGNLMNWMRMKFERARLQKTIKSLVVHPTSIEMLRNLLENDEIPFAFVIEWSKREFNLIILKFILKMILTDENFKKISIIDKNMSVNNENRHFIVILDNEKNENMMKILQTTEHFRKFLLIPIAINNENVNIKDDLSHGIVKVNFLPPLDVKNMLPKWPKTNGKFSQIVKHLEFDFSTKSPVMCTNVLAFLLLTEFRHRDGTLDDVCQAIERIRKQLPYTDFAFEGNTQDVLAYAIEILRDYIFISENGIVKPRAEIAKIEKLSMISKPLARHFALEAVVMRSAKYCKNEYKLIVEEELVMESEWLAKHFNHNFHFIKPCSNFTDDVRKALDRCVSKELLLRPQIECDEDDEFVNRKRGLARYLASADSVSESDDEEPEIEIQINPKMTQEIEDLIALLTLYEDKIDLSTISSALMISATFLTSSNESVKEEELLEDAQNLVQMLEYELNIPVDKIQVEVLNALNFLTERKLILIENHEIKINTEMLQQIDALKMKILPTLDAFYTIYCGVRHIKYEGTDVESFIKVCMKELQEDLDDGNAKYWESLNEKKLKSGLQYHVKCGFLRIQDGKVQVNNPQAEMIDIKSYLN